MKIVSFNPLDYFLILSNIYSNFFGYFFNLTKEKRDYFEWLDDFEKNLK